MKLSHCGKGGGLPLTHFPRTDCRVPWQQLALGERQLDLGREEADVRTPEQNQRSSWVTAGLEADTDRAEHRPELVGRLVARRLALLAPGAQVGHPPAGTLSCAGRQLNMSVQTALEIAQLEVTGVGSLLALRLVVEGDVEADMVPATGRRR